MSKQILLLDAFEPDDSDRRIVEHAADFLRSKGHKVVLHHLVREEFRLAMSPCEREAYETDQPIQSDEIRYFAETIQNVDALFFCTPTVMLGVPPVLKGWLDRVMVPGVGFKFNIFGRIGPGLRNIRRIGIIETTPHDESTIEARGDLVKRTLGRTLWLACSRRCVVTTERLPIGYDEADGLALLTSGFKRW